MKYRIKEYTNIFGQRVFQIQEKKWWGWKDADRYHPTHAYNLNEAISKMKWMVACDTEEAENKAKATEYHYK